MDAILSPSPLAGSIAAIPSKSVAHRMLICAALADGVSEIVCDKTSKDIEATARCLTALGAGVAYEDGVFTVTPVTYVAEKPVLDCEESGSTLRFLLPVACALGADATFVGRGRLGERPLEPLASQLREHGVSLDSDFVPVACEGRLKPGAFRLKGNVSSQFATGLLMAATCLHATTSIWIEEPVESWPYIEITAKVMQRFGAKVHVAHVSEKGVAYTKLSVDGTRDLVSPGRIEVEGDWSNAAFWLAADAMGSDVRVSNLDNASAQGDRAILGALALLGAHVVRDRDTVEVLPADMHGRTIDVSNMPDLTPPIAAVAATIPGTTRVTGAARLRIKESDRIESIRAGLSALGAHIVVEGDDLMITGVSCLTGGTVDAQNDHRIAMMAAVAATRAAGTVTIRGAECVSKSYPEFFSDYARLGGVVEIAKD
jgi:3-phosphoshikimate 1-carboxyvinyltransferase